VSERLVFANVMSGERRISLSVILSERCASRKPVLSEAEGDPGLLRAGNSYYVYIVASLSRTIYIGVTNDLARRVEDHATARFPGFTAKYHVRQLVYFEAFDDIRDAIGREKQLKRWRREKKIHLIEADNPKWLDLSGTIRP
jgi:putative endonuclease